MFDSVYSKQLVIEPSLCDFTGKLGIPDTFSVFMDIATEHAESMGIGFLGMAKRDLFWITAKTMIKIYRRPNMSEFTTITTWPEKPEGLKCFRDYKLTSGDEVLAVGKTLWAVMNMKTGRLHKPEEVYPEGLEISEERVLPEDFSHIKPGFIGDKLGEYIIRSTDIDVGKHMNNAAYLKAFASLYSTQEWKSILDTFPQPLLEVQFKNQCFEGDTLTFSHQLEENILHAEAVSPEGKPALQVLIY